MNKNEVDRLIPEAVKVLKDEKIANEKNEIDKTYRGQISTFGAAVINGSLISAVAFFSNSSSQASVDRPKLMKAIKKLIPEADGKKDLFEYVKDAKTEREAEAKEKILNAAIALKLAMNLYTLKD